MTGWGAFFFRALIALVMVPFLLLQLGRDGYGFAGLLMALVGMVEIADLGLRQALGRELAEQVARRDQKAFNEIISTSSALYLCIAIVIATTMWFATPWLTQAMRVPESIQFNADFTLRMFAIPAIFLSFITPVFTAALTSVNRFDLVNSIQIISGLIGSLALYVIIPKLADPIYGWVIISLTQQIIVLLLLIIYFRRTCPDVTLSIRLMQKTRIRPLFNLGGHLYALQLSQNLSERSDPFVVSFFFGPSGVSVYHPGGRLSQMLRPVVLTMADQMYPLATRGYVLNKTSQMQSILELGTRYTFLLGSLVVVGLFIFAEPFCRLWLSDSLGDEYIIAAYVMMGWALSDLLVFAAGTQWSVLLGMKRLKFLVWTQLPTAILNVLVSVYFAGFTRVGIPGVLAATIIIGMIRRPLLIWYTSRCVGLNTMDYLRNAYSRPLICLILTIGVALVIRSAIPINGFRQLGSCAILTTAVWVAATWRIGLNPAERTRLHEAFSRQFGYCLVK